MRCNRSSNEKALPRGTTISPSSRKVFAFRRRAAAPSSGKYRPRSSPDLDRRSTLSPWRDSRHRKPSHFGSYCHSSPRGIVSTERASMALNAVFADAVFRRKEGNGQNSSNAKHAISTQTAGYLPAASEKDSELERSDRGRDPLLELLLLRGADLARGHLAALEDHQGRDRHHAVFRGRLRALVDVELHDLDLVAHRGGNLVQGRRDRAAGAAPFGPEIDDHGPGRL